MEGFFLEFAIVIVVATLLGFLFQKLRQPVLLAFIVTGILLGSSFLNIIEYSDLLKIFSDFGIAFLLFLVGINLDLKIIKDIGKTSIVTGMGQIIFTSIIGTIFALFLGFELLEAIYIAVALTFSSTIIIVKLLSDKKELNALYGKIAIGFLIVQDFVVIAALVLISVFSFSADPVNQFFLFIVNFSFLLGLFFISYRFLVRKLFDRIAQNQELLFLASISWCFIFTAITIFMGFSKEIGAFLAGVSIASLPYTHEIFGKLKYLRDFFIVLFFVVLGSSLIITAEDTIIVPALIFSAFVLIGNPIIVFILMNKLGYKGRTSFLSSLSVAQISEFSLILIFLGETTGHVSNEIVSIITLVAIITISVSTYLIIYNNKIYDILLLHIPFLRSKALFETSLHKEEEKKYPIICIGFGDTGTRIFKDYKVNKEHVLIIDFDPRNLKKAEKLNFPTLYGDAKDLETINSIINAEPKIVLSTVMDAELNIILAKKLAEKKEIRFIAVAHTIKDGKKMQKKGIEFVIVPSAVTAKKIKIILEDIEKGRTFELNWLKKEFTY